MCEAQLLEGGKAYRKEEVQGKQCCRLSDPRTEALGVCVCVWGGNRKIKSVIKTRRHAL